MNKETIYKISDFFWYPDSKLLAATFTKLGMTNGAPAILVIQGETGEASFVHESRQELFPDLHIHVYRFLSARTKEAHDRILREKFELKLIDNTLAPGPMK